MAVAPADGCQRASCADSDDPRRRCAAASWIAGFLTQRRKGAKAQKGSEGLPFLTLANRVVRAFVPTAGAVQRARHGNHLLFSFLRLCAFAPLR
jgi:hypothetical protein